MGLAIMDSYKEYDEAVQTQYQQFTEAFPMMPVDQIYDAMYWNAAAGHYPPELTEQDILDYLEVI